MEIIKISNLSKLYQTGENEIKAIDNMDLTIQKGEFVAITGASGSRKIHITTYDCRSRYSYKRRDYS